MVVYDTYAWVEYFLGTSKGLKVRELLREEGGHTPSIVLAEISRKYLREEVSAEIVDITVEIALKAGEVYPELLQHSKKVRARAPSLADAIVYSTALLLGEDLVTGDKLFEKLPHVFYIGD